MKMGKYSALGDFLRAQTRTEVPMTFAQIERIIRAKLPKSHRYRAWWSNNDFNSVMTRVWLEAGYRSERVDMKAGKLVFRRVERAPSLPVRIPLNRGGRDMSAATRHPLFGSLKGLMRILPGTDLTQPADPEWAENA